MSKGPRWTPQEDTFLLECLEDGMTDDQISSQFHVKTKFENKEGFHRRTVGAIKRRRHYFEQSNSMSGIISVPVRDKPTNHHRRWSPEDDKQLKHYESMGMLPDEMAGYLNRTESAIDNRLHYLKHKKDESIFDKLSNFGNVIHDLIFGSTGPGGKP